MPTSLPSASWAPRADADQNKPRNTFGRCVMATHSSFGQVYHYVTIGLCIPYLDRFIVVLR